MVQTIYCMNYINVQFKTEFNVGTEIRRHLK